MDVPERQAGGCAPSAADQADGLTVAVDFMNALGREARDATGGDLLGSDAGVHQDVGEGRGLGGRIPAFHIERAIGFGDAHFARGGEAIFE